MLSSAVGPVRCPELVPLVSMPIHQRLSVEQLNFILLIVRDGRGGSLCMAPSCHAVQETCCTLAAIFEATPPRFGPLLSH
eukprot:3197116-Pyramimonas_sp.AAC.1